MYSTSGVVGIVPSASTSQELACVLEPNKEVIEGLGFTSKLDLRYEPADAACEELLAWLDVLAVQAPRVARPNPGDEVGSDALIEHP
jgi:hypothetical protein